MLPFFDSLLCYPPKAISKGDFELSQGGFNCLNWRNSIEFKFYGNQFHCARGLLYFFKCPFQFFRQFQSILLPSFSQSFSIRLARCFCNSRPRYRGPAPSSRLLTSILRAFFSFSHDFHLASPSQFNFPFISLLVPLGLARFTAFRKFHAVKSSELTIMNCLYLLFFFRDVFVYLHGCFVCLHESRRR